MPFANFATEAILCLWDLETGKLIDEPVYLPDGSGMGGPITYSSDAQDIVSGTHPDDIVCMNLNTKAVQEFPILLGLPVVTLEFQSVRVLALAPDDSSLAIVGTRWLGDVGRQPFLCIKDKNAPPEAPAVPVELNITAYPPRSRLGYHPSGDYICYGDSAWELAKEPPALITSDNLATILKETFPVSFECSHGVENLSIGTVGSTALTTLTFGSPVRQTLCIPPEFVVSAHSVHDGRIGLGSKDGRVMVLDFTHLLTAEETALLSRIREMRKISLRRMAKSQDARSG